MLWHLVFGEVLSELNISPGVLRQRLRQLGVAGADGWKAIADSKPATATLLLALVGVATRFRMPYMPKLEGTALNPDGSLYKAVRSAIEKTYTGNRRNQLIQYLDNTTQWLPGLGFDPATAARIIALLRRPGHRALIGILHSLDADQPTLAIDALPESTRRGLKGVRIDGGALRSLLEGTTAERRSSRRRRSSSASELSPSELAALLLQFPETCARLLSTAAHQGCLDTGLSLLDGLSPAAAALFLLFAPVEWGPAAPTLHTLRKVLYWFRVLDRWAAELLRRDSMLLARPASSPDPARTAWLWTPTSWDPLIDPGLLVEEIAITKALLDAVSNSAHLRVDAAIERRLAKGVGERWAKFEATNMAMEKVSYLVDVVASFAKAGGYVECQIKLPPKVPRPPDSAVTVEWCPPELIPIWLTVGDLELGPNHPGWRLDKALLAFGARPLEISTASSPGVGSCGIGKQLLVVAKTRPGIVAACPTALRASTFEPSLLDVFHNDPVLVYEAMVEAATMVDQACEALGLPVPPGEVLYRLRHVRSFALSMFLAAGLEAVADAFLRHDTAEATAIYNLLSQVQGHMADLAQLRAARAFHGEFPQALTENPTERLSA